MQMFRNAKWIDTDRRQPVVNPFDRGTVDEVPIGSATDITTAIDGLVLGASEMRRMPAWKRGQILKGAAERLKTQIEDFATTITREEGKPIRESRTEVKRAAEVLSLSAEEACRLTGETLPMDGSESSAGRIGFTLRVPCGVVAAITPFNFPLNLVTHKVGPAISGGNAILIKPAGNTPLSALKLTRLLLESGLPENAIACVTGPGGELGKAICEDDRVRKISFTGSYDVGAMICKAAGVKRVTMELGGNSPVIVMDDADLDKAAASLASAGFANAGQVCISAQRVIADERIRGDLVDALKASVGKHKLGDPLRDETTIGPLVREDDARRVEEWIQSDVAQGARLIVGGQRNGAFIEPAILDNVTAEMRLAKDELFGPAVGVFSAKSIEEAIRLANSSPYGLSAGIFTQDIDRAMAFARHVDSGSIHINNASQWRADFMPYGGLKSSGFGKEGPAYAIREMTEEKTVILHLNDVAE
jgi:acyl-CoA reductase-like NAD-dependent aldehyde dehydrogenase